MQLNSRHSGGVNHAASEQVYTMRVQRIVCPCFLGVYEREQQHARDVIVDVELDLVMADGVGASDQLGHVLNYELIADVVTRVAAAQRYALVETLCGVSLRAVVALLDGSEHASLDGQPWPRLPHPVEARRVVVRVTKTAPLHGVGEVSLEMSYGA